MALYRSHILLGIDAETIMAGVNEVKKAIFTELENRGLDNEVKVVETGTLGIAGRGVVMVIYPEGVYYAGLTVDAIPALIEEHIVKGRTLKSHQITPPVKAQRVSLASDRRGTEIKERIVLKNVGRIDPENIQEYIAADGYEGLGKALSIQPKEVIDLIKASNLKGRGGAGFPTGLKWSFTASAKGDQKYVICNADEGEPGTFKDRLIMEGDPHKVLEGMAICGYAVGATIGIIYIRGEYALSIKNIKKAIADAKKLGLLGKNIFGSGFDFDVRVNLGAGAYVCGEETALIESIEGHRGNPRKKPPFPANAGLWQKPTNVNNVETFANIGPILLNGADWFKNFGTKDSAGTKVYTLLGHINTPGLIEVPMGITLRQIISDFGGGMLGGKKFKLAQIGGTAGGILGPDLLDVPLCYENMAEYSLVLGSGAILVMDETTDTRAILTCFLKFFKHESCGQCVPCRLGSKKMLDLSRGLENGTGKKEDLDLIIEIADSMFKASLCPLGQSPILPIKGMVKYFKDELLAKVS
ncbi:MAG: NADH-quinone oxidoreductase subunit NuoF [Candidatus Coatesbacteria bacterium]|nr:NADH-quinone oxidoreductase subunit NuoF [Candidatus Coatesbacteria bacterium]